MGWLALREKRWAPCVPKNPLTVPPARSPALRAARTVMNINIHIRNAGADQSGSSGETGTPRSFNSVVPPGSGPASGAHARNASQAAAAEKKLKSALSRAQSVSNSGEQSPPQDAPKHVTIQVNDDSSSQRGAKPAATAAARALSALRTNAAATKTRFKVLLIGAAKAGKSSIFRRLIDGTFRAAYSPTQKSN
jgi:hypothetical protein